MMNKRMPFVPLIVLLVVPSLSTTAIAQPQESLREASAAKPATPHKADRIMSLSTAELGKILKDPQTSDFAKAKACQRLALIGDKSSVPELAALLGNAKLAHYARFALEPIPDSSVDIALRGALKIFKGPLLIGVINSIGRREDAEALKALSQIIQGEDLAAADAARDALARIRRP